jgi:N-acetylmuramoyl-L-alanine amidase
MGKSRRDVINNALKLKRIKHTKLPELQIKHDSLTSGSTETANLPKGFTFPDVGNISISTQSINFDTVKNSQNTIKEKVDRFNLLTKTNLGKKSGQTFEGFVTSLGGDEDGEGIMMLDGLGGLEGDQKVKNFFAIGSGSIGAIKATQDELITLNNAAIEETEKWADAVPEVLGAPSGGFLGKILKVAGIAGTFGRLAGAFSPLQGIADDFNGFIDRVLNDTGITKFLEDIKKGPLGQAIKSVKGFVNDTIETVEGVFDDTVGSISKSLKKSLDGINKDIIKEVMSEADFQKAISDVSSDFLGDVSFSMGDFLGQLTENLTGQIGARVQGAFAGKIPTGTIPSVVKNVAQGNISGAISDTLPFTDGSTLKAVVSGKIDLEKIKSIGEGTGNVSDIIEEIKTTGEKNGLTPGEIETIVEEVSENAQKLADIRDATGTLKSVIADKVSRATTFNYEQDLSVPFTYVSSLEELELEISSKLTPSGSREVNSVVIHGTETFTNKNIGAEEIDDIHKKLGHSKIGYHYIIRRDGRLQRGRPVEEKGEHCSIGTYDETSIGIAMVGGINSPSTQQQFETSSSSFTRVQYNTLEQFIQVFYNNFSGGEVFGHNDLDTEELDPYFDVQEYILSLFNKVNVSSSIDTDTTEREIEETAAYNATDVNTDDTYPEGGKLTAEGFIKDPNEKYKVIYTPQRSLNWKPVNPNLFKVGSNIPSILQKMADTIEKDISINSGYRNPEQNMRANGAQRALLEPNGSITRPKRYPSFPLGPDSPRTDLSRGSEHMYAHAVDISVNNFKNDRSLVAEIIKVGIDNGFRRIGVYETFVHMDMGPQKGAYFKNKNSKLEKAAVIAKGHPLG